MPSKDEIIAFMAAEFPQSKFTILEAGNKSASILHKVTQHDLRPGGTVSGPVLMGLADTALYVAILATIGIVPLTVTTSLTINFLRKPSASSNILGVCKLIKVGKTLVVGEVSLYSEGNDDPVAHVVGTYAIPPNRPQ